MANMICKTVRLSDAMHGDLIFIRIVGVVEVLDNYLRFCILDGKFADGQMLIHQTYVAES